MKPQVFSAIAQILIKGKITREDVSQMQIDGAFEILLLSANISVEEFKRNENPIDVKNLPNFLIQLQKHIENDLRFT